MFKVYRFSLVIALVSLIAAADSKSAFAQRRGNRFGGGSNNNNNSNNQDGNRRNRNREDDDKNSNRQQVQNLIQGGGQGGQGNANKLGNQQLRRNNQQGNQGQRQTFKNSNQLQQFLGEDHGHDGHGHHWHSQKFNRHNELQQWVVGFHGGPRPFSSEWYNDHPHAWHHHHDHDHWEIATTAGVLGWLGWQAVRPYDNTVYVYDPVPVETVIVDGQPSVVVEPGNAGDWITLGSYSLLTGAGDPGTRILDLSVDKQGNIRGSYYNMITNTTQNVIGVIDKNTQQVRWTLDSNQQLTFVATLDQLTESQGVVNVKLPGGQVQQWQLVRMENAPAGN